MENLSDPVETAIRKCENIQVFKLLSKIFQLTRTFISQTLKSAIKETIALNNKRNGTFSNIPAKR